MPHFNCQHDVDLFSILVKKWTCRWTCILNYFTGGKVEIQSFEGRALLSIEAPLFCCNFQGHALHCTQTNDRIFGQEIEKQTHIEQRNFRVRDTTIWFREETEILYTFSVMTKVLKIDSFWIWQENWSEKLSWWSSMCRSSSEDPHVCFHIYLIYKGLTSNANDAHNYARPKTTTQVPTPHWAHSK